jgi:hypothetical protein
VAKPGAKTPLALHGAPGIRHLLTKGGVPARSNGEVFGDHAYFVMGDTVVQMPTGDTIGTVATTTGRCTLVAGRTHLLIVDGTYGYTWDGSTFAQIADLDFPENPTHCEYIDTYFFVNRGGTEQVYKSAPEDPTDWNALEFTSAEARKDNALALGSHARDLYVFGSDTTEVFYNSGNADFPFDRYPGGLFEFGIAAPYSAAKSAAGVLWLARNADGDAVIIKAQGLSPAIVSDDDIEWQINGYSTIDDAFGFVYRIRGRWFYELNFPTAGKTWVYQIEDQLWHERESYGVGRHRVNGYCYRSGAHIVADSEEGRFGTLDPLVYEEFSQPLVRRRVSQSLSVNDRLLTYNEVVIEVQPGVGLTTGQGSDPQMALQFSDDGGFTWSNELWRSLGAIGNYATRLAWHNLGQSRRRMFSVSVSDPVDVTIIKAYADVDVGAF